MMKSRQKAFERMADKIGVEHCRLLLFIDDIYEELESLSPGETITKKGASIVQTLDDAYEVEKLLSKAAWYLKRITERVESKE